MTPRLIAIVPAAGIGTRACAPSAAQAVSQTRPKQYRLLGGVPMLRRSVQALLAEPRIVEVRVALAPDDTRAHAVLAGLPRVQCCPCGGPTRADTVRAAVRAAVSERALGGADWILVHDAARPGLPLAALTRLIDACTVDGVGGLLAQPLADTLKQSDAPTATDRARVARTLARDGLWLAQTPQLFRADLLLAALTAAHAQGLAVTDEASAMEAAGHAPRLVPGAACNLKLTWPEDFALMEAYWS